MDVEPTRLLSAYYDVFLLRYSIPRSAAAEEKAAREGDAKVKAALKAEYDEFTSNAQAARSAVDAANGSSTSSVPTLRRQAPSVVKSDIAGLHTDLVAVCNVVVELSNNAVDAAAKAREAQAKADKRAKWATESKRDEARLAISSLVGAIGLFCALGAGYLRADHVEKSQLNLMIFAASAAAAAMAAVVMTSRWRATGGPKLGASLAAGFGPACGGVLGAQLVGVARAWEMIIPYVVGLVVAFLLSLEVLYDETAMAGGVVATGIGVAWLAGVFR